MQGIREYVDAVRARQQRQWMWYCLSWGLVCGGIAGCVAGFCRLTFAESFPLGWIALLLCAGPAVGLVASLLRPRRVREAAVAIDRSCGLKDRVATALSFLDQQGESPIRELQISDALERVSAVDPVKVAPVVMPGACKLGLVLVCLAIVIGLLSGSSDEVVANVIPNPVIASQANRMAESLDELKEFNDQQLDPEVEQLLRELAEKIDELKQPGMDPKEALAKLSEMEAAVQQHQDQLAQQDTAAALQEVGDALSLAEPFEAAGQAMSQGELEEAAEELAKLDLPELDRKTEKSVTEKLNQVQQNSGSGTKRQLKNAVAKLSQGLSQGDRSKFKDGVEGLASECKKQGRRKKLVDLLRKQCQCLGECKSECEGQCKSKSQGKQKGGNNWGLGASGNDPGDKTGQLKTGPQMQVTGQESDQGDVDVETMSSSEQEQDAVRTYREQSEKYEQLSESVLSSEPIPLGHRQTIRRYFEMIRPQGEEADAVFDKDE